MYKTPSPVTAKRRLSGIPTSRRPDRVVSDQISRIQREWPDLEDCGQRSRRGSIATSQEWLKGVKDESTDSVDSSMGFRELERHIAKIKRQNFDLKLELHIRREKMTASAEKLQQAERLIEENEELHETLRETRLALKARDEELLDSKALIRLLSDQLENAHNRITSIAQSPRTHSPLSQYLVPSPRKTPILQSSEFPHDTLKLSPGSPESLRSLSESTVASISEDEEVQSIETENQDETMIDLRDRERELRDIREGEEFFSPSLMKEIRMPLRLEHSPRQTRRQSLLEEISPQKNQRTLLYSDRCTSQISGHSHHSSHRSSGISPDGRSQDGQARDGRGHVVSPRKRQYSTPAVSKVTNVIAKNHFPPTPDDTPVPVKPTQRPTTLRTRLFRSKSNLPEPDQFSIKAPETAPPKQVIKKSSLIRFWKSKSQSSEPEDSNATKSQIPRSKSQIPVYLPSPENTPKPRKETVKENVMKMPHESDQLSRYPKIRPVSISTTTTNTSSPKEWRQSIGRQVTEMVQHWEEESSRRGSDIRVSGSGSGSGSTNRSSGHMKRVSRDVSASPLAVKAARDAWTAKANAAKANIAKTTLSKTNGGNGFGGTTLLDSAKGGLKVDKLRNKRDELVRKLGLSTVPPNAAAA